MKIKISMLAIALMLIVIGYLYIPDEKYVRISNEYDGKIKYEVKLLIDDWDKALETADEDQNIAIHQYLSEEYNILSSGTECQIISAAPYESKYLLIQTECSLLSEI